jgi:cytochrome c2
MQDFANTPRIGTSLTEEGSKPVSRLDFGLLEHDIGESRTAWFEAKLHDPRIFDKDRIRKPLEKLRMPNFEFDDAEIKALTVFLDGLTDEDMPAPIRRHLQTDEILVQKGEWMIAVKNCRGCHRIDGDGGDVLALYEEEALGPPVLNNEGAKVQTVWLNNFLNNPTTLRPWLDIRMPSFQMAPDEQRTIIDYFEAKARLKKAAVPTYYDHELVSLQTHRDGRQVFGSLQCKSCHPTGNETPNSTPDNWGPDLALAQKRLRAEWIIDWLKSPQDLLPGTRMPSFFYDYDVDEDTFVPLMSEADEWMYNVRDYLMTMDRDKSIQ